MQTTPLLIGGSARLSSDQKTFTRHNPVDNSVASIAAAATREDAIDAVQTASAFFPEWSSSSPAVRRNALIGASQALQARADELINSMIAECGATEAWGHFNIKLAVEMLLEAASLTTQMHGQLIPSNRDGSTALAVRQPAGVIFSMAPWNAPVILGVRGLATPIACGNTVLLKSSELCPETHYRLVEILTEGGIPASAISLLSNDVEDAETIIETVIAQPAVRRVNFTGSTRVGRLIAEMAARHLKPSLLELGSHAPQIVLADADIEAATDAAVFGSFMNQGQICMSTERLVLHETIAEPFIEVFTAKVREKLSTNDTHCPLLGSVVDQQAANRIQSLINDAVSKGANLLIGGGGKGTLLEATVIDNVKPSMKLYREETFGPVVSVIRAGTDDEAVRIANDTEYGLTASVFSRDISHAMAIAKRIDSGICHINGPTVHDEAQMPFGGVKASGYGRFGGQAGIDEFTELRWITIQDGDLDYPF